ncbi:aldose epimerase family protein [Nocardioides sp.]|uniref:aldose epimerase family protein n=1 Tax=Nocardioides sp. TaxID=35761 RepID=UPI003D14BAE0
MPKHTEDGSTLVTLASDCCRAVLSNVGARLLELHVPDRDGVMADVVLARPTLSEVLADGSYMGAIAGRYAGRLRGARFSLDGHTHHLASNEGDNHLHGGDRGFDQQVWDLDVHPGGEAVTFTRSSPDGEEGYPGTVSATVTYALRGTTLEVSMSATTDRPTIVRLVQHAYWNLAGHDQGNILDHVLRLDASHYIPLDAELLPSGEVRAVAGTAYDFRTPKPIGADLDRVENSGAGRVATASAGYDDVWALDGVGMRSVATLADPASGRRLELSTDQPGICIYVGGYLGGTPAKGDLGHYGDFAGLTLETTGFPDDANIAEFPSPVLRPEETYLHRMRLDFSVAD